MSTEVTTAGSNNLANQLSILDQKITKLAQDLQPARDDQISARLMMLAKAGLAWPKTIDTDKAFEIYGFALARVPYAGLKAATEKLVTGEYEKASKDFMPTPAALAELARSEASKLISERARLRETRETLSTSLPEANSEHRSEAVERVRKMRLDFLAAHREGKTAAANPAEAEPFDADRAAYWKSIAALPDRSDITEEQRQYQRRVQTKIEASEGE